MEELPRPHDFVELAYRSALVPIFGTDVSASALVSAAKLVGHGGHVDALYLLPTYLLAARPCRVVVEMGPDRPGQAASSNGRSAGAAAR